MDPTDLFRQLKPILEPALDFLEQVAGKTADMAAERFGAAIWETLTSLWSRLRAAVMLRTAGAEALDDLREDPRDPDNRAALMKQVRKVIDSDAEIRALLAEVLASGALASVPSVVADRGGRVVQGGPGSVNVGGSHHGDANIYNIGIPREMLEQLTRLVPREIDLAERTRIATGYLSYLDERYRYLEFKGMGINLSLPLRMPLLELYVPLKARRTLPEGDTWPDALRVAGRPLGEEERSALLRGGRGGLGDPEPILDLLSDHDGLVILGDPGSGKTTLLKLIALTLATGQGDKLGLAGYLPILIPLSAYAEVLELGHCTLTDFIVGHLSGLRAGRRLDLLLQPTLDQGRALFLLDGLDEVKDAGRRNRVVEEVMDFYADSRGRGNRFLLTSRIVGYAEVRPCAEGLGECTLVDFGNEEIKAFVTRWTAAVERQARGIGEQAVYDAAAERAGLLRAIHDNPGARLLASNPLLLTILAVMKRQGGELPEERVLLYEAYIKSLLSDWHRVRSLARTSVERPAALPPDPHVKAPERVMEDIALWMQETAPGKGLVAEPSLVRQLEQIFAASPDAPARCNDFMDQMRGHAGLLVDRGGRRFGFIHLTFMEYLAGRALARQYLDPKRGAVAVVSTLADHLAEPDWRETSLLCLGALSKSHGSPEGTAAVIEGLLDHEPHLAGQAALLCGLALRDLGVGGVTADAFERTRGVLLDTMRARQGVPAQTRIACGEVLAELGDPRPEVTSLDSMQFCLVPAGTFFLGSTDEDPDAYDNEKRGAGEYRIGYDYWIARHPVTLAQFREYVALGGVTPEHQEGLKGCPTAPVARVDWHEADAFCRWLTGRWRQAGLLPDGWRVRLPSEPEWEKAARGGFEIPAQPVTSGLADMQPADRVLDSNPMPRRHWPWGETFEPDACHFYAHEVWRASPSGCFPTGSSRYGCEDMSGNLWEWTRSIYGDYPYPARDPALERRETTQSSRPRVLRGGAFSYNPGGVRCAFRHDGDPDGRRGYIGFRVVLSPSNSEL